MTIVLKRVYEKPDSSDGRRILVERLWPRGLRKADARIDEWLKDIAPSVELRKWYSHDPEKWVEFRKRYWTELVDKKELVRGLMEESTARKLTFLFGSKEEKMNSAMALKEYIESLEGNS